MGNCQAVDAAALVIQHPNGKIERMYWPIAAGEVMKLNPGHYVTLIIPLPTPATTTTDHHAARDALGASTDKPKSSVLEQPETAAAHRHHEDHRHRLAACQNKASAIRFTRVKLLRPTDTLVLGRAYRLVTSQEVTKVLRAKKHAKMKKNMTLDCQDSSVRSSTKLRVSPSNSSSERISTAAQGVRDRNPRPHDLDITNQATVKSKHRERQRPRTASSAVLNRSSKSWRPSLKSISEASG